MKRRQFLQAAGLSLVMAAIAFAFLSTSAVSQQNSLKDQLVGTWTLVSFEMVRPDGSKGYFGTTPKGVHTFDASGHFTLIFMRPDLPRFSSGDQTKVTPEEAQAISTGAISYFGLSNASRATTQQSERDSA
jgi:hypothetical protein